MPSHKEEITDYNAGKVNLLSFNMKAYEAGQKGLPFDHITTDDIKSYNLGVQGKQPWDSPNDSYYMKQKLAQKKCI